MATIPAARRFDLTDGQWAVLEPLLPPGRGISRLRAAADASGLIAWDVSVDSTTARAHQHAAGARRDGAAQREPPGGVDDEPPIKTDQAASQLKRNRAVASRYEKPAVRYLATIRIAAINEWLPRHL